MCYLLQYIHALTNNTQPVCPVPNLDSIIHKAIICTQNLKLNDTNDQILDIGLFLMYIICLKIFFHSSFLLYKLSQEPKIQQLCLIDFVTHKGPLQGTHNRKKIDGYEQHFCIIICNTPRKARYSIDVAQSDTSFVGSIMAGFNNMH